MKKDNQNRTIANRMVAATLAGTMILLAGCVQSPKGSMKKPDALAMMAYTPSPITGYATHKDGGVIYNPLSNEAKKTGQLTKYDNAAMKKAVLKAPGFTVEYTLPTEVAAYDMVPIRYKLTQTGTADYPLTLEANAFEEPGKGSGKMFDLAMPGKMDIQYEYLGYVTGSIKGEARNFMKADNTDTPAATYPNYTATELTKSGTVQSGDIVWLKFKYTNTGDTILDPEGLGGFSIYPRIQQKKGNTYLDIGGLYNEYVREKTYVYPGESREFWVNFTIQSGDNLAKTPQNIGLLAGEYNVEFTTFYRTEYDYQPYTNIWQGRKMQIANFPFNVADAPKSTEASPVTYAFTNGGDSRNTKSWIHYFEEFMTTYEHFATNPGNEPVEGTLWLQVAPWTKQIVIKALYSNPKMISSFAVPVNVDTESVVIQYNKDNINTLVNDKGLQEPVVYTQPMSDMRANIQVSPNPQESIIKDLLDMKSCGVNLLTTTGMPWLYDAGIGVKSTGKSLNTYGDAIKYTLDAARLMGFKMEGIGSYPFGRSTISQIAKFINGGIYDISRASPGEADYGDEDVSKANAVAYLYQRSRWGDLYWSDKYGVSSYTVEDTRGFMRYEAHVRYALGEKTKALFSEWAKKKYGKVETMNAAWNTTWKTFEDINPEKGQKKDTTNFGVWYTYNNKQYGFYEWSPALIDLDEFRTDLRVKNYEDLLKDIRVTDKDAKVQVRTEGSNFVVPGLDPTSDNDHYRSIIYSQLRGATVAEKIVPSDAFRSYTDYTTLPLTPSEISEVTKKSVDNGIIPMLMPQFDNMRDIVINDFVGDDYTGNYNLTNSKKGALMHTLTAVFPWWRATYEAGGVPGILWQDFQCDGFVTETQMKEMQFYKQQMDKALSTAEAMKMRKASKTTPEIKEGKNTYEKSFVEKMIAQVSGSSK